MAKIDGDDVELTEHDAALIKGMLSRGDKQHHIASYFGVDSRAVSHVATGKTFADVVPEKCTALPPPGPYRADPTYIAFYRRMVEVNALWNSRRMKEAKALLEVSLKSPMLSVERSSVEETFDDLFRDEFGILVDLNG
jgi:hypothetical protein